MGVDPQTPDISTGDALVAQLRGDEIASLRSEIAAGRREHILRSLDQRGIAQELIRQQYTGRYPFELLQNADDAAMGKDAGTVRFHLTDASLIVADQGSGFGVNEIRAICGLGRSSKDPRKAIGYKGLGFKSVGEISNRPQIISGATRFCFGEDEVRAAVEAVVGAIPDPLKLPVYALPFDLADSDLGEDKRVVDGLVSAGFSSVLRFPFKPEVTSELVDDHLHATLNPRLLLLLSNTERLEVVGTSRDFTTTAARDTQRDCVETLLDVDGEIEHWLVYSRHVDIPDRSLTARLSETWHEVDRVGVAAAVPLGDGGRPVAGSPQPLHVYFPTVERSGLGLILHGDFALELDRRHVSRTPEAVPYNTWLAAELADLVETVVVPSLVDRYPADAAVVRALAPVGTPNDFGDEVLAAVIGNLGSARFIPAVDGEPRIPAEVILLPDSVPSASGAHHLFDLAGHGRLAFPELEDDPVTRGFLTEHLGVTRITVEDLVPRLLEPPVGAEPPVYDFLLRWADKVGGARLAGLLAEIPCVRTIGGGWAAPADGLFFGRKRDEFELPSDLAVPIVDVPENPQLSALLQQAGVRPFEWRQLLPEFVLPLLTDPDTEDRLRSSALQALRAYFGSERTGDPRIRAQINRVLLPSRTADGQRTALTAASDLYFTEEWLGNDRLELIYGPFGGIDFLATSPPDEDDDRQSDYEFLEWIGVASRPRLDVVSTDQTGVYLYNNLPRHPHRRFGTAWDSWLKTPEVHEARLCDQSHDKQQLRLSFGIDRFPDLVAASDPGRLAAMWQALAEDWPSYSSGMAAEFHCPHGWHNGPRTRRVPSLALHMLSELAWLPCTRDHEPSFAAPRSAWRLVHDTPRRIAKRVNVLVAEVAAARGAAALADVLGVVDAARPAADDLTALLEGLAAEHGTGSANADIFEAARWSMRTLDDVLDRSGTSPVRQPPLLARLAGERLFHRAPAVALDPLLEETWEPEIAILDADRDLYRLHRTFGLHSLDNDVGRFPAGDLLPDEATRSVRARIDQAKPYLAALAVHETPSREDEVYRGLSRLEVVVYSELRLRYELDGKVRFRDEAVAFLAVRQEKEGRRRNIGTAHLEVDPVTGEPHWFVFGPQLAQFLRVPLQADAFALLLESDRAGRERFLTARRLSPEAVEEARIMLDTPPEDDLLDDLIGNVAGGNGSGSGRPNTGPTGPTAGDGRHPEDPGNEEEDEDDPGNDQEETPLPPIDPDDVEMTEGRTTATTAGEDRRGGHGGGFGPPGPADFARRERMQRRIGNRGEQVAFDAERRRLAQLGLDPEAVVWRSRLHPFAPYDIESLDEDGQRIFIEVKATTSDDPADPFEISEAELRSALAQAERYFIYRVTSAHTAAPHITRFQDPFRMLRAGHADLRLSGARLAFHLDP